MHPLTAAQTHPDSALRVLTEANAATSPDVVDHVNDAWLCPYGHICSGDLRTIFGRCGPSDLICVRQRDQNDLGAFAAYAQHPVAVLFAKISDISAGGLEDPQAGKSEHRDEREVARRWRLAGSGQQCLKLQVGEPQGR